MCFTSISLILLVLFIALNNSKNQINQSDFDNLQYTGGDSSIVEFSYLKSNSPSYYYTKIDKNLLTNIPITQLNIQNELEEIIKTLNSNSSRLIISTPYSTEQFNTNNRNLFTEILKDYFISKGIATEQITTISLINDKANTSEIELGLELL